MPYDKGHVKMLIDMKVGRVEEVTMEATLRIQVKVDREILLLIITTSSII